MCECHSTSLALCWPLVCAGKAVAGPSPSQAVRPHLRTNTPFSTLLHHAYLPLHYAFSHINKIFSFSSRQNCFIISLCLYFLKHSPSLIPSLSLTSLSFSPLLVLFIHTISSPTL